MNKKTFRILVISLTLLIFIASCKTESMQDNEAVKPAVEEEAPAPQEEEPAAVQEEEEQESADTEMTPVEKTSVLIPSEDGRNLDAVLYPAKKKNAPLIILMHWAPGDQREWIEIAHWLQNSGFGGGSGNSGEIPWLDPSWFPALADDDTYNILSFTFSGCEGGCKSFDQKIWLADAQAVVEFAYELQDIDQNRILVVGASIGADGAADGCLHLNTVHPGSCKGAFSISPGSYLTIKYEQAVRDLGALIDPVPALCLYAENDIESAAACGNFEADNYTAYNFPADAVQGNGHGMNLVEPDLNPNPLMLLVEFLKENL
jgi:dienelactone hydrolase